MSNTQYYFLPSIRQGLAAAIKPSANGAHRAQIDVTLHATARVKGTAELERPEPDISKGVQLYGPGDIVGFDPRIIVRTDPKPDVGDFEPNYFPAIEFADADFAWRYTAEKADGQTGRLMPWITLIVLVSEAQGDNMQPEFDEGSRSDQNLPPYIEVNTSVLPDLQHAWRWAHVHITGEENLSKDLLSELLRTEPERAVCRLLCTRRLAPKTHYTAFVVPTFELGILAGHGCELDPAIGALKPAWGADDNTSNCIIYDDQGRLRLPYYYRWDFQTSVRGDFEHLVRLLEPRKLSGLGIRDIDCEKPGFGTRGVNREGVDAPEKHYLSMEGALKSVDTEYTQWGRDDVPAQPPRPLQKDITNLINGLFCPFDIGETDAINNIAVSPFVGWTSVQIAWHTPIPSTSHVDYGETIDYGHSKDDPDIKYDHRLTLTGLTSGTTYHFKIVVRAEEGTVADTGDGWFSMLPSVVPPIYGRWHAAQDRVNPHDQEAWLDVLNLDPRHRAAAGLGSQVIRKQQEPLMASAWEQLGAIESANDILRRAQFGRDSSNWLYQRLDHLATEDFLRVTSPVHKRVIVEKAERGEKMTAAQYLKTQSCIPAAALDPAFRRILRPRGPIRKRQGAGRSVNLLSRLALGEPVATGHPTGRSPKPLGTTRLCDITRQLLDNLPAVTISANPAKVKVGETSTLYWDASNCTSCRASGGHWQGAKTCTGDEEVGPFYEPGKYRFYLTCEGPGGSVTASTKIEVEEEVPAPTVSLTADSTVVEVGEAVTLYWHASNCTSCRASGSHWQGAKTCTGDEEVGPFYEPGKYRFYLTCEGPGGSVTASTKIEVEEEVPAPTVSLTADSTVVEVGEAVTLYWHASNCTSCRASGSRHWQGAKICTGDEEVGPFEEPGEYTFYLTCEGPGGSVTASTKIEVEEEVPAPTVSLTADSTVVEVGEAVTLYWHASNCTTCRASGSRHWQGAKTCTGDEDVGPFEVPGEYTFYLTCEGPGGSFTVSITIFVMSVPAPTVSLSADPEVVEVGETSTLHWQASHCTSCRASGSHWQGAKICTGGDEEVGPFEVPGEYTLHLTGEGPGGRVTASTKIRVELAPDVDITVDPPEVNVGVAVTLHWHASNCTSCMASGSRHWQGAKICTGDEEVGPFEVPGEYTLHLTGEGPGGSVTASITILVMGVRAPTVSIFAWSDPLSPYFVFLKWSASNCTSCIDPFGGTICEGGRQAGVSLGENTFCIKCTAPEEVEKCVTITVRDDGSVVSVIRTFAGDRRVEDDPALRFCDGYITCQQIQNELENHQPFADVEDIHDPLTTRRLICRTLDDWLDKQPEGGIPEPPGPGFVDEVKEMVFPALDPNRTVVERTKKRLRLAGELAERFEEGAKGDPLDSIMWAPQFPQPMYEPLLDISHDLLLPGVEKIPQNTISLLETNRRFLESYMCGSNHEFASELLWRGYPTDQRGSYFRQFWDVSEYVPRQQELERLLIEWLAEQEPRTDRPITSVEDLPLVERRRILRRHLDRVLDELLNKWLAEANVASVDDLQDELKRRVIKRLQDEQVEAVSEIPEEDVNDLVTKLIMEEQLKEKLKDITHLISWRSNPLGSNRDQPGERLVLVVRGDLLKRYPNAMIYAIDAVPCDCADGDPVPGLREYLKCYKQDANGNTIVDENAVSETLNDVHRIFPVFQATLPPDLTFFGFPFSEEDARGIEGGRGKYFVIEEQVLEPRFGLDVTTDELLSWDDLSWTHFGLQEAFGSYLDENTIEKQPEDNSGKEWNDADTPGKPASSSATRAWITLQKPVRIAMHAKQMLPQSAYFEFKGPDPNDRFVIKLVDPEKIEHARKILRGAETGRTHIAGVIALEKASYNHPDWSYHMKPDSIEFFDEAKEVCDATMRYVEEHLDEVGGAFLPGNRWCPWGSELTRELKNMGE